MEWDLISRETQHAACAVAKCYATVRLGGAAGDQGSASVEQQLLECRAALAAQHAACEELRQWYELLMTAMRQAGGSV